MDYSKTPLYKKLGIKEGMGLFLINQPKTYFNFFDYLPDHIELKEIHVPKSCDFVHLFCTSKADLFAGVELGRQVMKTNGALWISWPKKSSEVATEVNRDTIRSYMKKVGMVDAKVASLNDTWSAMKYMFKKSDRD